MSLWDTISNSARSLGDVAANEAKRAKGRAVRMDEGWIEHIDPLFFSF